MKAIKRETFPHGFSSPSDDNVNCPVCDDWHNHIAKVVARIGADESNSRREVAIMRNGNLQSLHIERPLDYRLSGMSVCIFFECEQGHYWTKEIFTHKGDCMQFNSEE
jgi:hypothetical protein